MYDWKHSIDEDGHGNCWVYDKWVIRVCPETKRFFVYGANPSFSKFDECAAWCEEQDRIEAAKLPVPGVGEVWGPEDKDLQWLKIVSATAERVCCVSFGSNYVQKSTLSGWHEWIRETGATRRDVPQLSECDKRILRAAEIAERRGWYSLPFYPPSGQKAASFPCDIKWVVSDVKTSQLLPHSLAAKREEALIAAEEYHLAKEAKS